MGFVQTLKTGLLTMRRSFGVLRAHPKLLVFPLLSAVSPVVFFVGGVVGLSVFAVVSGVGEEILNGYWWLGTVAVGYFVAAVLSTFFNAALVHETARVLRGEQPSIRSGFAASWRIKSKIVVWGVISSVFGVVIEILESSDSRIAWFVSTILQASWVVLTFFVVPVMVFTDTGIGGMFEESADTFYDVWGESLTASFGIDLLSALAVVATIVGLVAVAAAGLPAVAFGAVVLLALGLVFALLVVRAAAHAVSKTALYEYAQTGTMPSVLAEIDIQALASGESESGRDTAAAGS
ncbi:hypothetical protein GRX03_00410 [Halovenus sp. WSH3]|uniref:Uncharacterized protein n=1 Tax=Halovenus carboxidivorans TaxID=2692199 RepID=A0A6B0T461_9EURY|nr:DUF6159 family protein [Halovenus carboxidivorans]MXR50072.1 hypothetical protein [Halovenus carboxidivorans]